MVKLVAIARGYALGRIIDPPEAFEFPDDLWNDARKRPSWAKLAKFGGKGDHDGDGKTGGSVKTPEPAAVSVPADWQNGSAGERKALAALISGGKVPNVKEADAIIAAYVETTKAAPFADAPEPQTIAPGNGVQAALGATQPDWVDPNGTPTAVTD